MRDEVDLDFHELINILANHFFEYGTHAQEHACLRAVSKIHPMPIEVFSFDGWDHVLREERGDI